MLGLVAWASVTRASTISTAALFQQESRDLGSFLERLHSYLKQRVREKLYSISQTSINEELKL